MGPHQQGKCPDGSQGAASLKQPSQPCADLAGVRAAATLQPSKCSTSVCCGQSSAGTHREGNSGKYSSSLVKLAQYKATALMFQWSQCTAVHGPVERKKVIFGRHMEAETSVSPLPCQPGFRSLGSTEKKRNLPVILPPKESSCQYFAVNPVVFFLVQIYTCLLKEKWNHSIHDIL